MKIKVFLIFIVVILLFLAGINVWQGKTGNFLFSANISQPVENLMPIKNLETSDLVLEAKAVISVLIVKNSEEKILFEKNSREKLPIASLAKLMSADIVLENLDLNKIVEISKEAEAQQEDIGNFKAGQSFFVKDLLFSSLIESSNDAIFALSEILGQDTFVELMNLEAENIALADSDFQNPTGLDLENKPSNFSTAEDLVKLTKHILEKSLIREIISLPDFDVYAADKVFHHKAVTTNQFLESSLFPAGYKIIGGKTGETPLADSSLILIFQNPKNQALLINVILGSGDRFGEMTKLIDWLNLAYQW